MLNVEARVIWDTDSTPVAEELCTWGWGAKAGLWRCGWCLCDDFCLVPQLGKETSIYYLTLAVLS